MIDVPIRNLRADQFIGDENQRRIARPAKPDELEQWMTAPAAETLQLQRPLTDGTLAVVATGAAEDQRSAEA